MSGLDSFFGFDDADSGLSAEAIEAFKERMRKNAAHIKALKKGEQKQKKKEDKLIAVLIKYIQSGQKPHIVSLIAKLLADNMPAALILSIISLGNPEMQREIEVSFALPEGMRNEPALKEVNKTPGQSNTALTHHFGNSALPLEIKIAMELWFQAISEAMDNYPHKTLDTACELDERQQKKLKLNVIQLGTLILRDFLDEKGVVQTTDNLREFIRLIFADMIKKIEAKTDQQKQLNEGQ